METLVIIIMCLILFVVQLLLCFKVKNPVLKLLPVVLVLMALAVFIILSLTASGWDSLGYVAFVLLFGISLIPCIAAWTIWAVSFLIKKRKCHMG